MINPISNNSTNKIHPQSEDYNLTIPRDPNESQVEIDITTLKTATGNQSKTDLAKYQSIDSDSSLTGLIS